MSAASTWQRPPPPCKASQERDVLELPGLADKGDVSDWVAAGGDADQLARLVVDAQRDGKTSVPLTDEDDIRSAFIAAPDLAASESVETAWILADYIAAAATTQLTGQPKAGKSLLAMCLPTPLQWPRVHGPANEAGHCRLLKRTDRGHVQDQCARYRPARQRERDRPAALSCLEARLADDHYRGDCLLLRRRAVLLIIDTVGRWASLPVTARTTAVRRWP